MEFGVWSLVPPVLTIALALTTKNVFISLLIGILTGNLVLNHFAVFTGLNAGIYSILDTMTESNTLIIGSVLITAAVIHLAEKSGGIEGFVNVVVKKQGLIKSKRGANLFTWLLGLVVFTSGTLSCMVTGSVARPVNDALKVPHEKAAFIVHTTSTPWCVLFPFSGWLAAMAGYLVTGGVPEDQSVSVLFQSLFMNFYCILAIVLVLVLALTQKDFGPMAKAEARAAATGELDDPVHKKEKEDYVLPRPLKIGDTVLIFDIDKQATVIGLPKNSDQVEVQAGIMKTRVPLSNLRLMQQEKVKTPQPISRRGARTDRAHAKVVRELDIRGQTAMEALLDVDNFIDAAVMAGVHQLSIIHGKGTGVLRAAVQQHLKKHPSVKSYRLGVFGEGESGVTIVELK